MNVSLQQRLFPTMRRQWGMRSMTWEEASIEALGLSTRVNNVLRAKGILTLGNLMCISQQELSYMPYLGPAAVTQILLERERFQQDPEGTLRRRQEVRAAREPTVITAETPLASLNLPARAKSAFRHAKINTVGQLCAMTREELLGLDRFGPVGLRQLEQAMAALGLALSTGKAREPKPWHVRQAPGHQRGSFRGTRIGPIPEELTGDPIETLVLPKRTRAVLNEHGIAILGDLEGRTVASLLAIKELGRAAVRDIVSQTAALSPARAVGAGRTPVYVNDLYLSLRARRSLEKMGVWMIGELCAMSQGDLTARLGIGRLIVWEIEQALLPHGLSLAGVGAEAAAGLQGDGEIARDRTVGEGRCGDGVGRGTN
jgi:DNA-directed RNA polymerase alpha subunit